jgi:hypothetical protein
VVLSAGEGKVADRTVSQATSHRFINAGSWFAPRAVHAIVSIRIALPVYACTPNEQEIFADNKRKN